MGERTLTLTMWVQADLGDGDDERATVAEMERVLQLAGFRAKWQGYNVRNNDDGGEREPT